MNITVATLVGTKTHLAVDGPHELVARVKERIQDVDGIKKIEQKLIYDGYAMEDVYHLSDYGVVEGSELTLVLRAPENITIQIRTVTGEEFPLETSNIASVGEVKEAIHSLRGTPVAHQTLMIQGNMMDDFQLLDDCGVEDGSGLLLVIVDPTFDMSRFTK